MNAEYMFDLPPNHPRSVQDGFGIVEFCDYSKGSRSFAFVKLQHRKDAARDILCTVFTDELMTFQWDFEFGLTGFQSGRIESPRTLAQRLTSG
jgi:hypothetical protein